MLSLIWQPDFSATTNPTDPDYRRATDLLASRDGAALQRFPRPRGFVPPGEGLLAALTAWVGRQGGRLLTLMVHGGAFDPRDGATDSDDPFERIYAPPSPTNPARLSWLPIVGVCDEAGRPGPGAAIAFGWLSRGALRQWAGAGWNNPYLFPAFDLAPLAAQALAALIAGLQQIGAPFSILAHGLGTRVVSQAIGYLREAPRPWPTGLLARILLLAGSEYVVDANRTLLGAGLGFEVFNLVNRSDAVLSWLVADGSHPVRWNRSDAARVIGYHGLKNAPGWLDLPLDRAEGQDWIRTHLGLSVTGRAPPGDKALHRLAGMNHWVGSMDPGNRALLRRLLDLGQPGLPWFEANAFPRRDDGRFDPTIPPTPMTIAARQAQWQSEPILG